MSATAGISSPWQGVFASDGARVEHEHRGARAIAWLRRTLRAYRSPAADRETLEMLHRNREIARRLAQQNIGDALWFGGHPLR